MAELAHAMKCEAPTMALATVLTIDDILGYERRMLTDWNGVLEMQPR